MILSFTRSEMTFYRLLRLIIFLVVSLGSAGCTKERRRQEEPHNSYSYQQYAPQDNQKLASASNIILAKETLYSDRFSQSIQYHVLYPPSYHYSQVKTYPVVIWLHGANGNQRSLRPLAEGFIRAMEMDLMDHSVVIFPDSKPLTMWVNSKSGEYPIESLIIDNLLPHIKKNLRVSMNRKDYHISGFSMGGYGAARLGFKYPNIFGNIVMVGAGTLDSTLDDTPRASKSVRDDVLQNVYGNDKTYFSSSSPRSISRLSPARTDPNLSVNITIIAGMLDEVYEQNVSFNTYLKGIGYRTNFISLPRVPHSLRHYVQGAHVPLFGSL